jgi:O-antigen/teichoic acid export membrane protein
MFGIFGSLNIPVAAIKFVSGMEPGDSQGIGKVIGNISIILLVTLSIVFAGVTLSSDVISGFYHEPPISELLKIYVFVTIFGVAGNLGSSIMAGFRDMRGIMKINLSIGLMNLPITLYLAYNFGIYGAITAQLLNAIIQTLLTIFAIRKIFLTQDIFLDFSPDIRMIVDVIKYSGPLFISGVVYNLFLLFGPTMLSNNGNFTSIGFYKVAIGVQGLILFIPGAINYNLMPSVSSMKIAESDRVRTLITKAFIMIMYIMVPLIVFLCIWSKDIISVLFGAQYSRAIQITDILILSTFFISLFSASGSIFQGLGKTTAIMVMDIGMYSVFIALSYILIGAYGLAGLGYTYIASYAVFSLIFLTILWILKKINLHNLWAPFSYGCLILILLCIIIQIFSGVWEYLFGMLLFCMAIAIEWLSLDHDDKMLIKKIVFDARAYIPVR